MPIQVLAAALQDRTHGARFGPTDPLVNEDETIIDGPALLDSERAGVLNVTRR